MDARRTPERPIPGIPRHTPDPTLERGFVASLRWLVAEGEARGVHRIAVELRALREAIATLDETRRARDEQVERAGALDLEVQHALRMLGDATKVDGNGSLVVRLTKLRDILRRDLTTRRRLLQERNSWRAMCEFQTRTRAAVHVLLEESERNRESLAAELDTLRERSTVLAALHEETVCELAVLREQTRIAEAERDTAREATAREAARADDADHRLAGLRTQLQRWSGTVQRALTELRGFAGG